MSLNPDFVPETLAEGGLDNRRGLPAWTYFNTELLEIEKNELFRRTWQLVGHVSNIPEPGDYLTLDLVGERAIAIRGADRKVRCFHNLCRHRGSRIVKDQSGSCKSAIVCPFHGWTYEFDGRLRGVSKPRSLPKLDPTEHGLVPLETEIWMGFVFVRFLPSKQPSVADLMRPYAAQTDAYRLAELKPRYPVSIGHMVANWKAVRDVDNEGYHVPIAHPGLQDLYGDNYQDDFPDDFGMRPAFAPFKEGAARHWSVRGYRNILPEVTHLPKSHRRAWLYIGIFPNLVLSLYPDQVGFYQEFPVSVDRTIQRSAGYALPDDRREMKLARYLADRIDRKTDQEDIQLIQWSWEAMQSSAFKGVILSDHESGVRRYHDQIRRMIPVTSTEQEPGPGTVSAANEALIAAGATYTWDSGVPSGSASGS